MIKVIYEDKNKYAFKGTIDLGILGKFENDMVEINFDIKDLYNDRRDYLVEQYKPLRGFISKDMSEEEIAEGLTIFYNHKIQEIYNNLDEIIERYLINVFDDMIDADFEFWEDAGEFSRFIIPEKMPECPYEEIAEHIYTMEGFNEFARLYEREDNYDIGEIPIKEYINKYFPMIDYDKLLEGIVPEYLIFEGNYFYIQCNSEDCDYGIVCSACAGYVGDYTVQEWHNF